ncbi:hypothetical protein N6L24_08575 [Cognatishimia sp. SS12]|uniref:hypothetical protein n=1 Tax=Cognatishimia sp. SS12 TaxID=2979465 RepID=UPI00232E651D|nr:hypothetical protein [Cognatishimia sp. SS12]MDC0738333.1 hypothetical protein [Cognatishimia sp. SS12]
MTRHHPLLGAAELRADLQQQIAALTAQFGHWRALAALLRHIVRPQTRPPDDISQLSDHHRRDIGLPPSADPAERWMPPRF